MTYKLCWIGKHPFIYRNITILRGKCYDPSPSYCGRAPLQCIRCPPWMSRNSTEAPTMHGYKHRHGSDTTKKKLLISRAISSLSPFTAVETTHTKKTAMLLPTISPVGLLLSPPAPPTTKIINTIDRNAQNPSQFMPPITRTKITTPLARPPPRGW